VNTTYKKMQTSGFELTNIIFTSTLAHDSSDLPTRELDQLSERYHSALLFCPNLSLESEKSLTLIHIFLQIRQTLLVLCLIDIRHK
jgi:hypothetical protein